jgi:hypothetical protein
LEFKQFIFRGKLGSIHDYDVHRANSSRLVGYLQKTPAERALAELRNDREKNSWAICCDKAYYGPEIETPGVRRLYPMKGLVSLAQASINNELKALRVPVECYFGRMWKLWTMLHKPYPYDHQIIDMDYENMALLTNEHIKNTHPLEQADQVFFQAFREERKRIYEEKDRKRQEASQRYELRRKRRYEEAVARV